MISALAQRLFGSANDRIIKTHRRTVDEINALEKQLTPLSDDDLRARTQLFRDRISQGEDLDSLLADAFATVREAATRTLGQRHYDVQLIGGIVMHHGTIAEMKTGEGKTLVATLPVYLNALTGKGVHVVTVNDYLAQRDAEWMGQIYQFLGLTVGCISHDLTDQDRRKAYSSDVTYGTNNELGFDYLRDNMKFSLDSMVQRPFNFAIIDEVDSILVDEARTPLIISGPTEDNSALYKQVDAIIPELNEHDYERDEKAKSVTLTEEGTEKVEGILSKLKLLKNDHLYDIENVSILHHVNQGLRAHKLFTRDTDYIVKENRVIIIDEFTGRMMEGRRYGDGLHQALEAKENAEIQNENQTLASITFQNYFRMYPKLAGMTGTAATESAEFSEIYNLNVSEIPTHLPMVRADNDDEIYRTMEEKWAAVLKQIEECHARKQPVLVGTTSIEKSELLSKRLKKAKIKHNVLNARYHEQEALIIAQAGTSEAVTIATNMAGRGTDIQLGGKSEVPVELPAATKENAGELMKSNKADEQNREEVVHSGGLYVIGTERHESRRIDNQLRGRSGRQGDPGASTFYLSLEDDLMRIFGSERMDGMLRKLGLEDGEAIVHPWINKALEKAQQKVEARNFDIRKNLLRFDDVMNDQRKVIYEERREIMDSDDVADTIADMRNEVIEDLVQRCIPEKAYAEQWQTEELSAACNEQFGLKLPIKDWSKEEGTTEVEIVSRIRAAADRKMAEKAVRYGPPLMRAAEKSLLLQVLDQHWKDHLLQLDHLRQGIGLRAYGQRDPLNEYKSEAFGLFQALLVRFRETVTKLLCNVEFQTESNQADPASAPDLQFSRPAPLRSIAPQPNLSGEPATATPGSTNAEPKDPKAWGKVGRNELCPCGSGKKYKRCHGKL
ncbi:MAG: preprotein translocase subunit SecA [Pseudomonadota bacterium]|nr:preprotein translocase subunit SecA [Pseudomonadota bacterium]